MQSWLRRKSIDQVTVHEEGRRLVPTLGWPHLIALGAAIAIAKYFTSKYLKQHRKRTFCQVVAGISCLSIPYGTALGVATFLALAKPSVTGLFDRSATV